MFSPRKLIHFYTLIFVALTFILSSCSERSEYGDASDYEKTGAAEHIRPTISSVSPTDNSTFNSPATTVAVIFSEAMSTGTITSNTSDTSCSGSFQLSSDNFSTCIKMSAAPSASNSDKTFTATPADNLSAGTTFKLQLTTSVNDTSSNSLASTYISDGFTTTPSGSGTIKGSVKQNNGSALSGVSVSYSLYGSTVTPDNTTTDNNGDFSRSSLNLGIYTLTYAKSGYNDASLSATLATDNQTLLVATLTLLANTCSAGTVSGTITDAVTGANVNNASINVRSGLNVTSGSTTGTTTTATNGTYTLSSMSAGVYTVQASKSGYISTFNPVYVCGNLTNQDASMSEELSSGTMRIVLTWPTGSTARDLDTHLQIPDNASGQYHIYFNTQVFYYATNSSSCSGCDSSDNATLDRDTTSAPGTETITITKVRSGTYSYSVHDYTNSSNSSSTKLAQSEASVNVYYNNTTTTYNVPNSAGTLWRAFTFTTSGGLSATNTMTHQSTPGSVY